MEPDNCSEYSKSRRGRKLNNDYCCFDFVEDVTVFFQLFYNPIKKVFKFLKREIPRLCTACGELFDDDD